MSGIWALLPFKGSANAKQRLGPALSAAEREALVFAMVRDVLDALVHCDALTGALVVSRSAEARALAAEFGAEAFADSAADLSGAVVEAGRYAATQLSASGTLFVPGDVPLITPDDVAAVLAGHRRVTLVPDARDVGTNAAASSPPNAFEYLFDGRSFKPHLAEARRRGLEPRIVRRCAFGLDIDTIEDLAALAQAGAGTRTEALLRETGLVGRLARPGEPPGRTVTTDEADTHNP